MEEDRSKEDYNKYYEKIGRIGKGSYGEVYKVKEINKFNLRIKFI